ncbi:MAG TPA: ABC transporter permease [Candidatus Angelobacter sp.]|nr:ABC transporter permease [Candidatus Angelobacter sp.]
MFFRLLFESFRRQKRRKSVALLAIVLGMTVATAMLAVANDVGDKVNEDLRRNGGNILLTPMDDTLDVDIGGVNLKPLSESRFIAESDLPKMKGIFWGHNIKGFVPYLSDLQQIRVNNRLIDTELIGTYFSQKLHYGKEQFTTGARSVNGWWKVDGEWPQDYAGWPQAGAPEVLAGSTLARQTKLAIGDQIELHGKTLRISGILNTGGAEDNAIVAPLHIVQQILGKPGEVQKVVVSALTKPEDAFGRRDPDRMTPADRDRWYCSPYANSISFQISEALPNVHAEQIRQVEQTQGKVLSRISGMMLLLTLAALFAAALAVSAAMAATILERRSEVGLMKSLGATNSTVASLFLTEAGCLAVAGALVGFFFGAILAHRIGLTVFGSPIDVQPVVLALIILAALIVTFAGSAGAVRKAMRFDPAVVLRGEA